MGSDLLLVIVVGTALAFDFTNGFHDTATAMATSIATRALPPRIAVALSAVLNVAGAFLSLAVATTIAKGVVDPSAITLNIIFAGLIGAITWNLVTWYYGLPSSSSHALIGGVVGAALVAKGQDAIKGAGIVEKVLIPAVLAPFLAGAVAVLGTYLAYRLTRRERPDHVKRGFRVGQIASASLVSLAHGTNDAQKTMGVITLALIAHGSLNGNAGVPTWVIVSAAVAIGAGTYIGGWRVIRTMGTRITEIEPPQGFAAQTSAAAVILAS
ncbi:MAG: inorganic phosphate transporter, PiT family, partial [Gaiellales bacterium]|nr:inorganic phosphate transporter, PiT family [Gaiellales bacterium]